MVGEACLSIILFIPLSLENGSILTEYILHRYVCLCVCVGGWSGIGDTNNMIMI